MTDAASTRPLPEFRNAGAEYWRQAARGILVVPTCRACGRNFWHPRPRCPHCASDKVAWTECSGKGVVHTFTVVRQTADPFFQSKVPYAVAMVRLDEGPMLMSGIAGCTVDEVKIGMRVVAVFEPASDKIAIPLFKPDPHAK